MMSQYVIYISSHRQFSPRESTAELQETGVRKPGERNNVFDIVNSQDVLQVAFKPHSEASMRNWAEFSEV